MLGKSGFASVGDCGVGYVWWRLWQFGKTSYRPVFYEEADEQQVDSILGATVQQSRYSVEKKVILQDDSRDEQAQVISGISLLSNNQVPDSFFPWSSEN